MKRHVIALILAVSCGLLFGQAVWMEQFQPKVMLIEKELRDGKLYLGWRSEQHPGAVWPEGGGPPNIVKAWREVYGVSNGVVVLERKEDGKVSPATSETITTPEKIEWPTK